MERTNEDLIQGGAQRKPQWRTPELLQDKLVDATNIDTIGSGLDGVISYGVPNVNSS
jgi:hypothetical protein